MELEASEPASEREKDRERMRERENSVCIWVNSLISVRAATLPAGEPSSKMADVYSYSLMMLEFFVSCHMSSLSLCR